VFINLLKNAGESLNEKGVSHAGDEPKITISLALDRNVMLEIFDNGKGFPPELMNKITEPYVTTREKGTGLGLAIVKKIVDDHGGSLELMNDVDTDGKIIGARIRITFLV